MWREQNQFPYLCFCVHACCISVWFVLWRRPAFQLCSPIKISRLSTQPENIIKQWGKPHAATHSLSLLGLFTFLWSGYSGPRVSAVLYVFIHRFHPRWHLPDKMRQREEEEEAGKGTQLKIKQCRGGTLCGLLENVWIMSIFFHLVINQLRSNCLTCRGQGDEGEQ